MRNIGLHFTYSLDSLALLLSDTNRLSSGRQGSILVSILSKQLKELLWMVGDHLRELGVSSSDLLQDRFKHLRLLLYDLSQLLELWVVAQKVKAIGGETSSSTSASTSTSTSTGTSSSAAGASTTSTAALTLTCLCSCLEEIYWCITLS
jgi:hypothetical protein